MIPIPASILAIENESDRDFMENIFSPINGSYITKSVQY